MKFLNLEDNLLEIEKIEVIDDTKYIYLNQKLIPTYCPVCGSRMYSKGIETRTIKHQTLQDGFKLILYLKQRRWKCSNSICNKQLSQSSNIVAKYKQHSLFTEIRIMEFFKNLNLSCKEIADRLNVSDTFTYYTFMQYVNVERLPLPKVLCIDEVYINLSPKYKYAVILMNWENHEIIDILPSRWNEVTEKYFLHLPYSERKKVEYVVSDMYKPYVNITDKYFPNACSVTDSFHIIALINRKLIQYCNKMKHQFDDESLEYYLLSKYHWFMTSNDNSFEGEYRYKYNRKYQRQVNLKKIRKDFFSISTTLGQLKEFRDMYTHFNTPFNEDGTYKSKIQIEEELTQIIHAYAYSKFDFFQDTARTLIEYKDYIINSFITLEGISKRMSNGPMESFNRKPKDYKRMTRGFTNFDFFRARMLWGTRINPIMLAIPRDLHKLKLKYQTSKKRGPYKK